MFSGDFVNAGQIPCVKETGPRIGRSVPMRNPQAGSAPPRWHPLIAVVSVQYIGGCDMRPPYSFFRG